MLRLTSVICICLVTLSALGEPASKYEVGTIIDVKIHQAAGGSTNTHGYEVSLRSSTSPGMLRIRWTTARWLAFAALSEGRYFLLSPASLSALSYERNLSRPVIRLWNDDHHVAA